MPKAVEVTFNTTASPDVAICAFTDHHMLSEWWQVERSLVEKKPGGLYTLAWNISTQGFGFVSSGVIKTYHPTHLLEVDHLVYLHPDRPLLGPMSLSVSARKAGNTQVTIRQDGYQVSPDWDWYYNAVKEAWPEVAENLRKYLNSL